ncbi:MAG: hypothetical protein R2711_18500 [Acidimicrobiales bacterium]
MWTTACIPGGLPLGEHQITVEAPVDLRRLSAGLDTLLWVEAPLEVSESASLGEVLAYGTTVAVGGDLSSPFVAVVGGGSVAATGAIDHPAPAVPFGDPRYRWGAVVEDGAIGASGTWSVPVGATVTLEAATVTAPMALDGILEVPAAGGVVLAGDIALGGEAVVDLAVDDPADALTVTARGTIDLDGTLDVSFGARARRGSDVTVLATDSTGLLSGVRHREAHRCLDRRQPGDRRRRHPGRPRGRPGALRRRARRRRAGGRRVLGGGPGRHLHGEPRSRRSGHHALDRRRARQPPRRLDRGARPGGRPGHAHEHRPRRRRDRRRPADAGGPLDGERPHRLGVRGARRAPDRPLLRRRPRRRASAHRGRRALAGVVRRRPPRPARRASAPVTGDLGGDGHMANPTGLLARTSVAEFGRVEGLSLTYADLNRWRRPRRPRGTARSSRGRSPSAPQDRPRDR